MMRPVRLLHLHRLVAAAQIAVAGLLGLTAAHVVLKAILNLTA